MVIHASHYVYVPNKQCLESEGTQFKEPPPYQKTFNFANHTQANPPISANPPSLLPTMQKPSEQLTAKFSTAQNSNNFERSRYLGVIQLNHTQWEVSSGTQSLLNGFKTEEEAADAYDAYLREFEPFRYERDANFCPECGHFVNPLKYSQYVNECICQSLKPDENIQSGDLQNDPTEPKEQLTSHTSLESISSSVFDCLDDEGLIQEGLKDIQPRVSIEESSIKTTQVSPDLPEQNTSSPSFSNVTLEPKRKMHPATDKPGLCKQHSLDFDTSMLFDLAEPRVERGLNKLHSLDYNIDAMSDVSQHSDTFNTLAAWNPTLRIDTIAEVRSPEKENWQVSTESTQPATPKAYIKIQTKFLHKYWRNDRKNIQCFPYCPEHGDYYRVRIENLQHSGKGVCRAPVKAHIHIPFQAKTIQENAFLILARCNNNHSPSASYGYRQVLSHAEMKVLEAASAIGIVHSYTQTHDFISFDVEFLPDVWKFDFELPKKRRHNNESIHLPVEKDDTQAKMNGEFVYYFEIDVYIVDQETLTFQRLGRVESGLFEIASTRTLVRQRNRLMEEQRSPTSAIASRFLDDEIVEQTVIPKKKVRIHLAQLARSSTLQSDTDTDTTLAAPIASQIEPHPASKQLEIIPHVSHFGLSAFVGTIMAFGIVHFVVSLPLLLLAFVLPCTSTFVGVTTDKMAQMDLYAANKVHVADDAPHKVHRLISIWGTQEPNGALWRRFGYLLAGKTTFGVIGGLLFFILSTLSVLSYPFQSISTALRSRAIDCALWIRRCVWTFTDTESMELKARAS